MLRKAARGFTLIELMIVVAIIGILASIAIPNFLRYQLRAKSGEAAVNLGAIKTNEIAYFGNNDVYVTVNAYPTADAPATKKTWVQADADAQGWDDLGWKPEGPVYFTYSTASGTPATGAVFSAIAVADMDGGATPTSQCWNYRKSNVAAGTDALAQVAPCTGGSTVLNAVVKASADGEY